MDTTRTQQTSIYNRAIHSGKWVSFGTITQRILNLVGIIVLARLLLPADYGVIAIIFLITGILDDVSTTGFSTALLQRKNEDTEGYLETVWTWDLMRAVILALIIFFASGLISDFFKVADHRFLISLSGLFLIISALGNKMQLYFFKHLDFKKIFLRDLVGQIAYISVAIGWAICIQASVVALFIGNLSKYIVAMIMSYVLQPSKINFNFRFRKLWDLMAYSKWIYGQNILNYFLTSLDKIFIGRILSSTDLGLYARAKDLPTLISSPLLAVVNRVGFSAFALVQDRLEKIQEGFLKSLDLLLLTMVPFCLLLIVEGGTIVSVILGPKWLGIVIPLKLFSIGSIFIALVSLTRPLFNAIGKPNVTFKANVLQIIISPLMLYYAISRYQLKGAVIATISIWFILLCYTIYLARPILRLGIDKIMPSVVTVGIASIGTLTIDILFRSGIHRMLNQYLQFVWVCLLGSIYAVLLWWSNRYFKSGPWYTLRSVFRELKPQKSATIDTE